MSQVTKIVQAYRLDNYAVVVTLLEIDVQPGDVVNIDNMPAALSSFEDNNALVVSCPQYRFEGVDDEGFLRYNYDAPIANQVLYQNTGSNTDGIVPVDPYASITVNDACTWIDDEDIEDYLGIPLVDAGTTAFLVQCAAAANAFAFRRRQEAGWVDEKDTSPSADVTLGTIMIGAAYYRQRSSYNTLASFDGMGAPPATGVTPMIMQLLGVNRPQVA